MDSLGSSCEFLHNNATVHVHNYTVRMVAYNLNNRIQDNIYEFKEQLRTTADNMYEPLDNLCKCLIINTQTGYKNSLIIKTQT